MRYRVLLAAGVVLAVAGFRPAQDDVLGRIRQEGLFRAVTAERIPRP